MSIRRYLGLCELHVCKKCESVCGPDGDSPVKGKLETVYAVVICVGLSAIWLMVGLIVGTSIAQ